MALTRSMLKGMQLTEEQVSAIIDEHIATVDGLKADRDKYKADAAKYTAVQKELDELKNGEDDWKSKYEKEHADFEAYKKDVATKEERSKVRNAYKDLLSEAGVGSKHIDAILRVTEFDKIKLDKEGKLVDANKLAEGIKSEWAGFITSKGTKGVEVDNPPTEGKSTMTKDQILSIKDTTTRQKAIADNIDLFK